MASALIRRLRQMAVLAAEAGIATASAGYFRSNSRTAFLYATMRAVSGLR